MDNLFTGKSKDIFSNVLKDHANVHSLFHSASKTYTTKIIHLILLF